MEKTIIDAIRSPLPMVEVYHDFAPDNAGNPLVILQRVGGAGNLFMDNATPGGYQIRLQLAVWAVSRLEAVSLSLRIEKALAALPGVAPIGAAQADYDPDTELRGMRQDFYVLE